MKIVGKRFERKAQERAVVVRMIQVRFMLIDTPVTMHGVFMMRKQVYKLFGSSSEEQQDS